MKISFVEFSEPLHTLTITNGTIEQKWHKLMPLYPQHQRCAYCEGYSYRDDKVVKSQKNPNVLASDLENVKKIEGETLVSSHNVADVLEK